MNRLKYLREENGKTQNEVAKYLGIKGPAYNLIENGQRRLSAKMLEKLAEYFDVSTDYILGRTIARTPGTDILGLTEVGFNSSEYKTPTQKQKEQIRQIVETILDKKDE
jgi:transcriptional regulator with XRE-family HTH domain